MILAYWFIYYLYIPFWEFLAFCLATILIVLTTRIFSRKSWLIAYQTGVLLAFVYCWIGLLIASTIHVKYLETPVGNLNWFSAFIAGSLWGVLFKPHILLTGWTAGLPLSGAILIIAWMLSLIVGKFKSKDTILVPVPIKATRQFTVAGFLCISTHMVIAVALANWLTPLFAIKWH